MNKSLILLAFAATAASAASAGNLWTGSCTFANYNVSEGSRPVVAATAFTDAAVGDKLVFAVSDNAADTEQTWHQLELWSWDGESLGSSIASGTHIESATTQVEYTLDETLLAALKEGGFALAGTGYTVTSIDLTAFDGTIWEGECVCESWNATPAVTLPGSSFVAAKEGDVLVFDVAIITAGSWAAIQIDNGTTFSAGAFGQTVITESPTQVTFTLNADLLTELQTYGINITGANFKLTKISLVAAGSEDPASIYGTLWEGECVCTSWSPSVDVSLAASKFTGVKEGDVLTFDVTITTANEYACLQLLRPSDSSTSALGSRELSTSPTQVVFTLDTTYIEELTTNGIKVGGTNITVTRITLAAASDVNSISSLAVDNGNADKAVYNLRGVKVADALNAVGPGIYICNGSKYVVR